MYEEQIKEFEVKNMRGLVVYFGEYVGEKGLVKLRVLIKKIDKYIRKVEIKKRAIWLHLERIKI